MTALSTITRIRAGALTSTDILPTIPVAQHMSWAARRVTTRPEDAAYCLLGLFSIHLPMLYGEGAEKAFLRLQEEILKETNDLTLFAWSLPEAQAASQPYWGILASSPLSFSTCQTIESRFDTLHASECAVTSKGIRVTPVHGAGLRTGHIRQGGYYGLDLGCYDRNTPLAADLGIILEQLGCDMYARVRPTELDAMPQLAARDKNRVFYVAKTVAPARAVEMRAGLGRSISFAKALSVLYHEYGFKASMFWPEGHWDMQKRLFLTKGVPWFRCQVLLQSMHSRGEDKGKEMVVACRMSGEERGAAASVLVDVEVRYERQDPPDPDQFLKWRVGMGKTVGPRLQGKAVLDVLDGKGFADGQPVFVVEVYKK